MLNEDQIKFLGKLRSLKLGVPSIAEPIDDKVVIKFTVPTTANFSAKEILSTEEALAEATNVKNIDFYKKRSVETLIADCENRGIYVDSETKKRLMSYTGRAKIKDLDSFLDEVKTTAERTYSEILQTYEMADLPTPAVIGHLELAEDERYNPVVLIERDDEYCTECGSLNIVDIGEKVCKNCGYVLPVKDSMYIS